MAVPLVPYLRPYAMSIAVAIREGDDHHRLTAK